MDLYRALNCPVELKNWKSEGGDPCWSAMFLFSCSKLQGFSLIGNLGDQLLSLQHLKNLDLSRNKFSGDLPASFRALNNLTSLIGGNQCHRGVSYLPWKFPTDIVPDEQNMSSPLTTESSSIGKYPSHETAHNRKKRPGSGGIVIMVVGAVLSAIGAAVFITVRFERSQRQSLDSKRGSISSKRQSFSKKCKLPICAMLYTVAELHLATNNFSPANLLGEGTLGSVYRSDFPDGQILAVKNIKTIELSIIEEEQFMEVIRQAFSLRHPNIVALVGYVGHGNHLLVHEYIRNVTLDDALHNVFCMPLTWSIRLCIEVGIARALNYLHTSCVPLITRSNLKAANILLDEDLNPRTCDCGVAVLKPLASKSGKIKAPETAIEDSGYGTPEHAKRGSGNPKADIYSFGVLLLELLTRRRPVGSSKPKGEQSLVECASSKLHDNESLLEMIDPNIKRTISFRTNSSMLTLSPNAFSPKRNSVLKCLNVQSLVLVLQKSGEEKPSAKDRTAAEGSGIDPCEKSFCSTNSRFFASPTASYYSI